MSKTIGLRILLGTHQFFPEHRTGTEVLTLELARGLRDRNHTVHIITCVMEHKIAYTAKPWLTHDKYDGFSVHRLHFGVSNWNKIVFLELSNPDRIALIKDLISTINPDIVHFNHIVGLTGGIIPEIKKMGIPTVFSATDFWAVCPAYTLYKRFEKKVCEPPANPVDCLQCLMPVSGQLAKMAMIISKTPLHRLHIKSLAINTLGNRPQAMTNYINSADAVFVSTRFLANTLIKGGINEKLMRVVNYGVDIGDLPEPLPIPERFSENSPLRLGFIGTLSEKKGVHVILDALTRTLPSPNESRTREAFHRRNIELLIYGKMEENDPYCNMLKTKAESCDAAIRFAGIFPHEKIGEILRGIHILIIPSIWHESSPLVLTSALNAHTPLIVSDLGGLTEMINGGNYGFSFAAGNGKMLDRTISTALDNPGLIARMRQNMKGLKRTTRDYVEEIESEYLNQTS
ncbi:MAG: hypothetical protein C0392_00390 [Syntrophus sp. (in: bacteria)]|nr:hypothetical protein [Syntrophus sp. (in: bacteria)]